MQLTQFTQSSRLFDRRNLLVACDPRLGYVSDYFFPVEFVNISVDDILLLRVFSEEKYLLMRYVDMPCWQNPD